MCLQFNGRTFVNGLFDYYIPNNLIHGEIERRYARYLAIAEQKLSENLPESAKEKWVWFKEYVKAEAPEGLKWMPA